MKPSTRQLNEIVDNFRESIPPQLRVMLLPALVGTLAAQDFDELRGQVLAHIVNNPAAHARALESLAMVERWVREAETLAHANRSEKSTIDSSNHTQGDTE